MRLKTIILVYLFLSLLGVGLALTLKSRHAALEQKLRQDVSNLWGRPQVQYLPELVSEDPEAHLAFHRTDVDVNLNLQYRQKGHYWYSTYTAAFTGEFQAKRLSKATTMKFPLPNGGGMFRDFSIVKNGEKMEEYEMVGSGVELQLEPGVEHLVEVTYTAQGSDEWWFNFESRPTATQNLELTITTDFLDFDFPDGSVSPTHREAKGDHQFLQWNYENLLNGARVGLELPEKQDTGPALISICQFAPLGLLLFTVAVAISGLVENKLPHAVHFVLLGAGYYGFHLLLVYLSEHLGLLWSFVLAASVSTFLCCSYGKRVFSSRFVARKLLPSLLFYLVAFSSAFLVEGFRGLPLVALLVVSLYFVMQLVPGLMEQHGGAFSQKDFCGEARSQMSD